MQNANNAMRQIVISVLFPIFFVLGAFAQGNYQITNTSVGKIKLGMSVSQARKSLKGFQFERSSDGEGIALIAVIKNGRHVMTLFAGEEDPEARINDRSKIQFIEVWDSRYRMTNGLRTEMSIRNAEKILGRVTRVYISEIESREFVEFRNKPKGLIFRIGGRNQSGEAGIYPKGKREGTRYAPNAFILSIQISKYLN